MSKADFDFCNNAQKPECRAFSINIKTGKKITGEHFRFGRLFPEIWNKTYPITDSTCEAREHICKIRNMG